MKRLTGALLVIGLIVLGGVIYYAGIAGIGQALHTLGWLGFSFVCLIHVPVIVLLGSAWWSVGRDISGARAWKFVWARYVRESAAEVLPFSQLGGIVIGARALAISGMRMVPVAVSMLADLVIELAAKLPYVLSGIVLLFSISPRSSVMKPAVLGAIMVGMTVVLLLVFHRRIKGWLENLALQMAQRWPVLGLGTGSQIRPVFAHVFARDWRIVKALNMHLVAWLSGALETWFILRLMGTPISASEAIVIDSLVAALRTFGFAIPAAIGFQEGGYVLLGGVFGIDPALAVALSLVRRARELALGVPGLGMWQVIEGHRAYSTGRQDPPSQSDTLQRMINGRCRTL